MELLGIKTIPIFKIMLGGQIRHRRRRKMNLKSKKKLSK